MNGFISHAAPIQRQQDGLADGDLAKFLLERYKSKAMSGGYAAKNGALGAPMLKNASNGSTLGDDFPMLCETCLGPNPYVRMTKTPFGNKLCKISNIPYQGFKWKAGPGGRYKETIICYAVAAERNICQTCLNDMKYGLPVGVRDAMLAKPENQIALPQSIVGQQYFYEQQSQMVANGEHNARNDFSLQLANVVPDRQLDQFARAQQYSAAKSKVAFRNLPKLCSFWLNGSCTRVLRKTCPFRPCCGTFVFPEIAGSAREICADLVKLLEAEGPADVQKKISAETRQAFQESMRGNRDDAIRKRVSGEDDLTRKYMGKMKDMNLELEVPEDPSIITLWLGNVDPAWSEDEIRTAIYPYGQFNSIHIVKASKCAFVEYLNREIAEYAAKQMYNALLIYGNPITVKWAKPKAINVGTGSNGGSNAASSAYKGMMLPPPGMESQPTNVYSLPGLPPPQIPPVLGFRPREPPMPPPGAPPASAYTDSDGNESSAKRVATEANNGGEDNTTGDEVKYISSFSSEYNPPAAVPVFRPPPPPKILYPSMNPSRMGASGFEPI